MEYGQIKGIEKSVSRLVQGTVYFKIDEPEAAFELCDVILDAGGTTFDTAHGYGRGDCERVLGQWINSRGVRDQVVILDKGAHPYDGRKRVTHDDITSDIHDSLERLQTDYIDLYVLHRDDEEQPVEMIVDTLNEHHDAGRIHAFGGSNWSYERIAAANDYAEKNGLVPFAVSSPQFSLAEMVKPAWDGCISIGGPSHEEARAWYLQQQMPLFTWASLAGGFMTGRYRRDNLDQLTDYFDEVAIHAYCYEDNFKRLDRADQLAAEKEITLPQLSLAYVFSQPLNIYALVGARSVKEYQENLRAFHQRLTDAEVAWLELRTDERPF